MRQSIAGITALAQAVRGQEWAIGVSAGIACLLAALLFWARFSPSRLI